MGEKYISPYDTIGKMREEIKQQAEKAGRLFNARWEHDSITFPQWIEMLTNYIEELQEAKEKAQRELAEFEKDKEIQLVQAENVYATVVIEQLQQRLREKMTNTANKWKS